MPRLLSDQPPTIAHLAKEGPGDLGKGIVMPTDLTKYRFSEAFRPEMGTLLLDRVPDGTSLIYAYLTPAGEVVVPEQEMLELASDDERHNCDEMGCGSCSHVMMRGKKERGF